MPIGVDGVPPVLERLFQETLVSIVPHQPGGDVGAKPLIANLVGEIVGQKCVGQFHKLREVYL